MSTPSHASRPRLRWWALGALAVVVVAALVIIVVRVYAPDGDSRDGADGQRQSEESPTPGATGVAEVTGCLGGESRDGAMVRDAQRSADHTEAGAVEVAAAFVRWLNQYPYPDDADDVQGSALSADAPTRDLVAFFDGEPDLSGGLVAANEPYWLSTVSGVYLVEESDDDRVTASIGTALVRDGEMSPSLKGAITVTVSWEDGQWAFVRSEGTRTTEDLFAAGTPFSGGC